MSAKDIVNDGGTEHDSNGYIYSRPKYLCVSHSLIGVVWCWIVFTVDQMLYELQIGGDFSQ